MFYVREMDILTFGEEQAKAAGVETEKVKWILLGLTGILTGSAVAFAGVIGFLDLIAPHVVRKIFGSSHRYVLPMSIFFGGIFMVIADLISRTLVHPRKFLSSVISAHRRSFLPTYFSKKRRFATLKSISQREAGILCLK